MLNARGPVDSGEDWLVAEKKGKPRRAKASGDGKGASAKPARGGKRPEARPQQSHRGDPSRPSEKPEIVVVGIGASAGGLHALREFLRNVADDSGLAYVVVMHLSPEHESHLADLLQPHSRMQVVQVGESTPLKPDCVYVIPPNANLSAIDTHLRLTALEERRDERAPIDHFFRTLAQTHDGHAIGVILTGTGSDGTLGIKEIKLRGGLTVVQDPNEAEYDGMPQSAIATGYVDLVLPVSSIPSAVLRFARTDPRLPVAQDGETLEADHRVLLQKVFAQVRARTGRDFTRYKRSTIMRRIQRRMQLRYVEELDGYVEYLRHSPEEVRALSDDLLINVTSFFRDPAVFDRIRDDVVPALFADKGPDDEIRIWCVGCATGEEVYSIAMLMLEEAARREGLAPRLHIFASDLHERSLEVAREGFYPGDIAAEVSKERLKRFFVEETGGFRVRKEVRQKVVFAPHNLLGDPPFSRLDLIVCRNLMIYLQRDVQSDVLRLFHYALKPGGMLVLGTSETVDDAELFRTFDKQHSIHRRGHAELPEPRLPVFPITRRESAGPAEPAGHPAVQQQYEAMHQALVNLHARASMLVGPDGQVVHLSSTAGRYLEHPGGRVTASASKLVRKELSIELISALHAARKERAAAQSKPVQVRFNGDSHPVVLHVHPALEPQHEGYSLVTFEEADADALLNPAPSAGAGEDKRAAELAAELDVTRRRLQGIIEQFETSREEMKASNEELQSTNEELRSTMEELETSKEELQSMNEELQTVNQENRHKVEELALLSSDLQNLLTATDIATLFLDRELRILRFTPKVGDLFNMRMTDRGRPVSDLTHRLGYPELMADAERVLRKLSRLEREVKDEEGRWYLTHLLPYRSTDDRIAGVVITFVDITSRKLGEERIQELSRDLEQRVADRTHQVRDLSISLVRAEQRERRRLSETMHDELQQILYGAQLKLRLARDEITGGRPEEAAQHMLQAETLLTRSTRVTRQLSIDLNPPILKNEGLNAILGWLQGQMKELHGLEVHIRSNGEIRIDDGDVRVLLFQIFRELLFNVAKHSGSQQATVSLSEADGHLRVVVADDGKGFDAAAEQAANRDRPSVGLTSVRERVGLLGGSLDIRSNHGEGTTVTLRLPKAARIGG
jgi:two-component system CheB/CheR fusion protein